MRRYRLRAFRLRSSDETGATQIERRKKTEGHSTYVTLVGAMVLARTIDDRALSQEILDAGLASVKD